MCLAIPSKIVKIDDMIATVDVYGARRDINLMLLPEEVGIGDYVLVHAGFALQKVDQDIAEESLRLIKDTFEQNPYESFLWDMVKNDRWIIEMAKKGMIEPFNHEQVRKGVISFGVSSYGYDIRISDEFKMPNPGSGIIDPKNSHDSQFRDYRGDICEIPANAYVICRSLEYLRIPRETLVLCFGKSTYARSGVIVNITPLEPEWEGNITISVSNTSPFPVRLYAKEGIAQIVFLEAKDLCEMSYADKKGKYQAQKGIVLPKI